MKEIYPEVSIENSVEGSFGDKKAKTQLSRDAHTKGMLTFPRSRFTSFSSKIASLSPYPEVSINILTTYFFLSHSIFSLPFICNYMIG